MFLDDEVFSVYPGKSNNPLGDIIKGRTFARRLNVTRKIVIKHVPDLIKSALNMQTFALGQIDVSANVLRNPHGQPSFLQPLPHGRLHQ